MPAACRRGGHRALPRHREAQYARRIVVDVARVRPVIALPHSPENVVALETLDPQFAASVRPGDILVAGRNFGCGSAMEIAVTVILVTGIRVVVAESFARTFYRNAINNGLLPVECDTSGIVEGDTITVRLHDDRIEVTNTRSSTLTAARPLPTFMREIHAQGGLVPYLRSRSGRMEE